MVAIAMLVCRLQNKKHFGFCVSQQAVPISNRRAQQGAQADAGYSASCFLVSRARRGLALRYIKRNIMRNYIFTAAFLLNPMPVDASTPGVLIGSSISGYTFSFNLDGAYEKTENGYAIWSPGIMVYKVSNKKEILWDTQIVVPKNCRAKIKDGGWAIEILNCSKNSEDVKGTLPNGTYLTITS